MAQPSFACRRNLKSKGKNISAPALRLACVSSKRMNKWLLGVVVFSLLVASCSKGVRTPPVPAIASNNAYVDLRPGRLRIVVPLLSAGTPLSLSNQADRDQTLTFSAAGSLGYETVHYTVAAARGGRVRLLFVSAETTKDGTTSPEPRAPSLPFVLPVKAAYARLIYLQRASQTDHNMAILASHRKDVLENVTKQVLADPAACRSTNKILCSWVPPRIAVRTENNPC